MSLADHLSLFCLKSIALLEILGQAKDRHSCIAEFSRVRLPPQSETYFITDKSYD